MCLDTLQNAGNPPVGPPQVFGWTLVLVDVNPFINTRWRSPTGRLLTIYDANAIYYAMNIKYNFQTGNIIRKITKNVQLCGTLSTRSISVNISLYSIFYNYLFQLMNYKIS